MKNLIRTFLLSSVFVSTISFDAFSWDDASDCGYYIGKSADTIIVDYNKIDDDDKKLDFLSRYDVMLMLCGKTEFVDFLQSFDEKYNDRILKILKADDGRVAYTMAHSCGKEFMTHILNKFNNDEIYGILELQEGHVASWLSGNCKLFTEMLIGLRNADLVLRILKLCNGHVAERLLNHICLVTNFTNFLNSKYEDGSRMFNGEAILKILSLRVISVGGRDWTVAEMMEEYNCESFIEFLYTKDNGMYVLKESDIEHVLLLQGSLLARDLADFRTDKFIKLIYDRFYCNDNILNILRLSNGDVSRKLCKKSKSQFINLINSKEFTDEQLEEINGMIGSDIFKPKADNQVHGNNTVLDSEEKNIADKIVEENIEAPVEQENVKEQRNWGFGNIINGFNSVVINIYNFTLKPIITFFSYMFGYNNKIKLD